VYLGRNKKHATPTMTTVHATVSGLATRTGNLGQKLYTDILSSILFNDLHMRAIHCCGTVKPNQKIRSSYFERKIRIKQADIMPRMKGDLTAVAWKDKPKVNILTDVHCASADGNVRDSHGNTLKPATVQVTA
jgi:hypothetical protein